MVGASRPQRTMNDNRNRQTTPGRRLTEKKEVNGAADVLLKEHGLHPGKNIKPTPKIPGDVGIPIRVDTNIYPVKLGQCQIFRYEVRMTGSRRNQRPNESIELIKRSGSSVVIADRLDNCRKAFNLFRRRNPAFFAQEGQMVYYDLQSCLCTLKPLDFVTNTPDRSFKMEQDPNRASNSQANGPTAKFILDSANNNIQLPANLGSITLEISQVSEGARQFELSDLRFLMDQDVQNRNVLNFLELAINQYPIWNENQFLTFGGSMIYFNDGDAVGLPYKPLDETETKYLASGVSKSAFLMKGSNKEDGKQVGIMLEAKYSPFYSDFNLLEYLMRHDGTRSMYPLFVRGQLEAKHLSLLDKVMRDIHLTTCYPHGATRKVDKFSFDLSTANSHQIPDLEMTVADYYADKYRVLTHPNAHLVKVKQGSQYNYYPPEFLKISDNQSVNMAQMNARNQNKIMEECAMRPDVMQKNNRLAANAIQLRDNSYLTRANIQVNNTAIKVQARVLRPPLIRHGKGELRVGSGEAKWPTQPFLYPISCKSFAIYWIRENAPGSQSLVTRQNVDRFIENFRKTGNRLGMRIGQCQDSGEYREDKIKDCVQYCKENKIEICIFVTPENAVEIHENVKLYERRFGVVTQNLKSTTIEKVNNGDNQMLENFLAKTNIKLCGLNWSVKSSNVLVTSELEKTLFIGISMSHSGPKSAFDRLRSHNGDRVGVLGYSANFKKRSSEFVGDYFYITDYRSEAYAELREIAKICTSMFCRERGCPPSNVVFYYNGLTKGAYENAYKYSIPLIQDGIKEGNGGNSIPLTLIGVNKKNGVKLFPEKFPTDNNAPNHEFNVPHGIVVDTDIISPSHPEFHLMAHSTPSGNSNIPRYSILIDENHYSMNTLEQVTHILCYQHQIDGGATSLVSPLMIANEYADRGTDIFNAALREEELPINKRNNISQLPRDDNGNLDLSQLSLQLNYGNTNFYDRRITA